MGRPSEFKEEYIDKLDEFFNVDASELVEIITTGKNDYSKTDYKEIANALPTFQKFAYEIKVNKDTLVEWNKQGNNPKYDRPDKELKQRFSVAYTHAKAKQESIWLENSLKNLYNAQFAIFLGKNVFGYKDNAEITHKLDNESSLKNLTTQQLLERKQNLEKEEQHRLASGDQN